MLNGASHNRKFRDLPHGLSSAEFTLCESVKSGTGCAFGASCTEAHSKEELTEWKERYKREHPVVAQQHSLAQALEQFLSTGGNRDDLLVSELPGVRLSFDKEKKQVLISKLSPCTWVMTLSSRMCVKTITLLVSEARNNFKIASIESIRKEQTEGLLMEGCSEWENPRYESDSSPHERIFKVQISFHSEVYGNFRQTIVVDYGMERLLEAELLVVVQPPDVTAICEELVGNERKRWEATPGVQIVKFDPSSTHISPLYEKLLAKNPPPDPISTKLRAGKLTQDLTVSNYIVKLHTLLELEEMEQNKCLARFNITADLDFFANYKLLSSNNETLQIAAPGELFTQLPLTGKLSEDLEWGRLLIQNVNSVLLASGHVQAPSKVYEALIMDKAKEFIILKISKQMVKDLDLQSGTKLSIQAQFVGNRTTLCEMHYALDQLADVALLFPANNMQRAPWMSTTGTPFLSDGLNERQREALLAITSDVGDTYVPPILLIGSFGTGKTMTIANSIIHLLRNPAYRILVCTHSNSAADLYIQDYLDDYISQTQPNAKVIRVLYAQRWTSTVHPVVQKYCLFESDNHTIRCPTVADLEDANVIVITLAMCFYLNQLYLEEDFFTHILIDEAAQAMETETLLPLCLASKRTRIALGGDHMQMNPTVVSPVSREHGLHRSLMDRLFYHYKDNHPCKILLTENYRSHEEIVKFASELFYDCQLVTKSRQPAHPSFYPLSFYAARGDSEQHTNSTGFYNMAEVYEVVDVVGKVVTTWPKELWGALDESSIGVVSFYQDQVVRLRHQLRQRGHRSVSVERVQNVQGKQFRALFISTVRTYHTCQNRERDVDYGFLSNAKLLNTAITRAQSLVVVVGDPMSLCVFGKCRSIWKNFIERCDQHNSLHGVTWSQIKDFVDYIDLRKSYKLNPLAKEFIPGWKAAAPPSPIAPPVPATVPSLKSHTKSNPPLFGSQHTALQNSPAPSAYGQPPSMQFGVIPSAQLNKRMPPAEQTTPANYQSNAELLDSPFKKTFDIPSKAPIAASGELDRSARLTSAPSGESNARNDIYSTKTNQSSSTVGKPVPQLLPTNLLSPSLHKPRMHQESVPSSEFRTPTVKFQPSTMHRAPLYQRSQSARPAKMSGDSQSVGRTEKESKPVVVHQAPPSSPRKPSAPKSYAEAVKVKSETASSIQGAMQHVNSTPAQHRPSTPTHHIGDPNSIRTQHRPSTPPHRMGDPNSIRTQHRPSTASHRMGGPTVIPTQQRPSTTSSPSIDRSLLSISSLLSSSTKGQVASSSQTGGMSAVYQPTAYPERKPLSKNPASPLCESILNSSSLQLTDCNEDPLELLRNPNIKL